MNTETLKAFRLTHDEWYTLAAVAAGNYPEACHDPKGLDLDVLILAGLVSRLGETLALTADGAAWSWGGGESGCLGHGDHLSNQLLPKKVEPWAPGQ